MGDVSNAEMIWHSLSKDFTPIAIAGIMGNLRAESAFKPDNVQNSFENKLGTDAVYTDRVDRGIYGREKFSRDGAGYGLAQWTHWSRKAALWDALKANGLSIADLGGQLSFMISEIKAYGLYDKLNACKSVKEATGLVLRSYEKPADQSDAAVKRRAAYGEEYLDKYGSAEPPAPDHAEEIREALAHLDKVRRILEGL